MLRPVDEQCERIARVRSLADVHGIPLVINARVDCFVSGGFDTRASRINECVARANAYSHAGADCIYPMGPGDRPTLTELRDRIPAPLNVLGARGAVPLRTMKQIGINRVSFGPFVFRSCLGVFVHIVEALRHPTATCEVVTEGMLSRAEVGAYLIHQSE